MFAAAILFAFCSILSFGAERREEKALEFDCLGLQLWSVMASCSTESELEKWKPTLASKVNTSRNDQYPIDYAITRDNFTLCKGLLDWGADPNSYSRFHFEAADSPAKYLEWTRITPLQRVLRTNMVLARRLKFLKLLLEKGASPQLVPEKGVYNLNSQEREVGEIKEFDNGVVTPLVDLLNVTQSDQRRPDALTIAKVLIRYGATFVPDEIESLAWDHLVHLDANLCTLQRDPELHDVKDAINLMVGTTNKSINKK